MPSIHGRSQADMPHLPRLHDRCGRQWPLSRLRSQPEVRRSRRTLDRLRNAERSGVPQPRRLAPLIHRGRVAMGFCPRQPTPLEPLVIDKHREPNPAQTAGGQAHQGDLEQAQTPVTKPSQQEGPRQLTPLARSLRQATHHFRAIRPAGQWALSPIVFPSDPTEARPIEIGDASDGRHSTQPDVRSELTEGACSNSLLKP